MTTVQAAALQQRTPRLCAWNERPGPGWRAQGPFLLTRQPSAADTLGVSLRNNSVYTSGVNNKAEVIWWQLGSAMGHAHRAVQAGGGLHPGEDSGAGSPAPAG